VRETCDEFDDEFDSIFQIVGSDLGMRSVYKIYMTALTTSSAFIMLIIEVSTRAKITANDYGTRVRNDLMQHTNIF